MNHTLKNIVWYRDNESKNLERNIKMVTLKNKSPKSLSSATFSAKAIMSFAALGMMVISSVGCGPNTPGSLGGSDFGLQALMVTRINTDGTSVSSTLKWNQIGGADHYELARTQNGSSTEVNIGSSKILNTATSYSDANLQQTASYKYIIRAIDANNKVISKGETEEISPITSTDLQAAEIQDMKFPPDSNTVSREANLKWSSIANSDLYYASIVNNSTSKQIFGVFTKETTVNINATSSPINPPDLIKQELPILTGGLEKEVRHKFNVYTIKFNNTDLTKATAIGLRQSREVLLIL